MLANSNNVSMSAVKAKLKFVLESKEYAPLCLIFKVSIIRKASK